MIVYKTLLDTRGGLRYQKLCNSSLHKNVKEEILTSWEYIVQRDTGGFTKIRSYWGKYSKKHNRGMSEIKVSTTYIILIIGALSVLRKYGHIFYLSTKHLP